MNYLKKSKNLFNGHLTLVLLTIMSISLWSCDPSISSLEFDLPETNSKADVTPPSANFSAAIGTSYLIYNFANLSASATTYAWNFGDNSTATTLDATHTYASEGTFTVTLTVSDAKGVTSTISKEINVVKPPKPAAILPIILNPSFDEPGTDGKYTSPWVDNNLGKTIQISTSSSFVGTKSAKFPDATSDPRIGYQSGIAVTPNTDYKITYNYSIETGGASSIKVSILGGTVTSPSAVAGATLQSHTGTIQLGKTPFETVTIFFNSGANNSISIHMANTGTATGYVEEFTAEII